MNRFNKWMVAGWILACIGLISVAGAEATEGTDACAMLHKEDVEAAFIPRKFDSGQPGDAVKSAPERASVSSCTFTSRGSTAKEMVTVTLGLRVASSDSTGTPPAAAWAGAIQLNAKPVAVEGLGEGAYMVNLGDTIQLNVFRGKREWLIFGSRAKMLDSKTVLARLTKIAEKTLAR